LFSGFKIKLRKQESAMSVESVISNVKKLEERFLEDEDKTGDPEIDQDTGEVGTVEDRFEEVESLMSMAQNSALTAVEAIDQLLKRGHQDKLDTLFGEGAKELLEQAKKCMASIADLFNLSADGKDDEEESEGEAEDDEESDDDSKDKESEKEPEDEESEEEPESEEEEEK
jgi:hypothetical protein